MYKIVWTFQKGLLPVKYISFIIFLTLTRINPMKKKYLDLPINSLAQGFKILPQK